MQNVYGKFNCCHISFYQKTKEKFKMEEQNNQNFENQKNNETNNLSKNIKMIIIIGAAIALLGIVLLLIFFVFKHEHNFGNWYPATNSTCTQKGIERRECSCGEYETREMNLLEHSYDEWEIIDEATCISKGKQKKKCLICGYVYEEEIPQTTSHDYTDYGCRDCGKYKYNVVVDSLPITVYDSDDGNTITVTSVKVIAVDTYGSEITINWWASSTKGGGLFLDCILLRSDGSEIEGSTIWIDNFSTKPNVSYNEISDILFWPADYLVEGETYTVTFKAHIN